MNYISHPHLLLEALAYYGRRAADRTWDHLEHRIRQRKLKPSPALLHTLAQLQDLTAQLDQVASIQPETLQFLFGNLEGFAHNTIGSSSRAFFLLYPLLEQGEAAPQALLDTLPQWTPQEVAGGIAGVFSQEQDPPRHLEADAYLGQVLALTAPDATKVALLELSRDYAAVARQALEYLAPVYDVLKQRCDVLEAMAQDYAQACRDMSTASFFSNLSRLSPSQNTQYTLRPFLFGADTNLTSPLGPGAVCIYGGILRRELLELIQDRTGDSERICEVYRLLGDSTRFDILCFLRSQNAYVQDLAAQFGVSRNTIHHHMNKLLDCGLVRCTVNGNRMCYCLDHSAIQTFLESQTALFGTD